MQKIIRHPSALLVLLLSCVMACLSIPSIATQENITVYYNERPPYLIRVPDDSIVGLTGSPAVQIFRIAGVPVVWLQLPSKRQLAALQENHSPACAVGWFKTAERERFAKFTKPIYQDRPTVGLASADSAIPDQIALSVLLADKTLRVLVKAGYSYGPYIDQQLQVAKSLLISTSMENLVMARMITRHHADIMFAAEEGMVLRQQNGQDARLLRILHFSDVPKGERRYILCSHSVSDQVMQRLDAAISTLNP